MINALRYGLASFLRLSKPFTFVFIATFVFLLMVELSQVALRATFVAQQVLSSVAPSTEVQAAPAEFSGMTMFAAQANVMNALVLMFLSIPVAGQFAQEYRYNTVANAFLLAPRRTAVFVSKLALVLVYVSSSVALMWIALLFLGPLLPDPIRDGTQMYSPLYAAGLDISWQLTFQESWWRVLLYVCGYMTVVSAFAVITKSQTLGVLIPLFFLGLIETAAHISDLLLDGGVIQLAWIPDQLRFFLQGQAWVNQDAGFPYASSIYFGGCLGLMLLSLLLFIRRDTKV